MSAPSHAKCNLSNLRNQHGAVFIVMLVVLVMGAATVLVSSFSKATLQIERDKKTAEALAQAKEALIGYAVTYADTHVNAVDGYFPCPDSGTSTEGIAAGSCGSKNVSMLGRLPWKTLGLPALRDGGGECLWYAISGTYKNNPKTDLMNWDTNGQLQVFAADGTTRLDSDNDQVIAVIIAPSVPVIGQNRVGSSAPICGGNYTAAAYLDNDSTHSINNASVSANASDVSKFVQGTKNGDVNDQMVFITRQELWSAMQKRSDFAYTLKLLTQRTAECLADYGRNNGSGSSNKSLPWPAPIQLSDYADKLNYNDTSNEYSGRIPYKVNTSNNTTNNDMSGDYLMSNNGLNCFYYSASPSTELQQLYPWWENWKDHLFYALSYEFRPKDSSTHSCGNCVGISGRSDNYAAIVLFANKALTSQTRASVTTTNSSRGVLGNYLEGLNLNNHPNYGGNDHYQTDIESTTFNDVLYCINTNLTVIPCP